MCEATFPDIIRLRKKPLQVAALVLGVELREGQVSLSNATAALSTGLLQGTNFVFPGLEKSLSNISLVLGPKIRTFSKGLSSYLG